MGGQQVKVMYYAPLPEGRSHAAFSARWRQHGELAMGLPLWRHMARYVQFDALVAGQHGLADEQLGMLRNADYGGVGSIWFHSAEALAEAVADPDNRRMEADELETFGRRLGSDLVAATEHVVIDRGPAAITVLNALHRTAGVSRASFSEQWRAMGDALAATPELARHVRSYVQDHALPDAEGWDGMVELGFDAPADFFAFVAEPKTSEWMMPHEAAFIDIPRGRPLITAGAVLYAGPALVA
ncbi:MAG TPA: EthD domain-containing protein [Baekduia sp.]